MKIIYVILGTLFLTLGIIGAFLPLLPTTPFLLLSAGCYMRSSQRLYGWLLSNRWLGSYIRNYRERRAMTAASKAFTLALLWGSLVFCIFWIADPVWLKILLGAILSGVTAHIFSFKTVKRSEVVKMKPVRTTKEMEELAGMARTIWREYYSPSISSAQIDYMLEKFQSVAALTAQIAGEGYEYYFINAGGENVGYIGLKSGEGKIMLSKIYILKERRGKGYAGEAFCFIENLCLRRSLTAVWLTVNRNNTPSIDIYRKRGFEIVREQAADIGGGFVMDDYIMEMIIKRQVRERG